MKTPLIFFMLVFCFGHQAFAGDSAIGILKQFFGPNGIENKELVYHGEMLRHYADKPTLGQSLKQDLQISYRKLTETENSTIYAVLFKNSQISQDWYAFLVKENETWKISAIRNLALTGIISMALQELEKKDQRSEEEEWSYQNMRLTLQEDKTLKSYLQEYLNEFNTIALCSAEGRREEAEKVAKKLYIHSIEISKNGILTLTIGGILDNNVGFLHIPAGTSPPTMTPEEFIYIERITEEWYIYKTT